eukprot:6283617-Heterocapsa_arctica.AAC.1
MKDLKQLPVRPEIAIRHMRPSRVGNAVYVATDEKRARAGKRQKSGKGRRGRREGKGARLPGRGEHA